MSATTDAFRRIRVENLPESADAGEEEAFYRCLVDLICEPFSLRDDAIQDVQRCLDEAENVSALVTFRSRAHRNLVFAQRKKLLPAVISAEEDANAEEKRGEDDDWDESVDGLAIEDDLVDKQPQQEPRKEEANAEEEVDHFFEKIEAAMAKDAELNNSSLDDRTESNENQDESLNGEIKQGGELVKVSVDREKEEQEGGTVEADAGNEEEERDGKNVVGVDGEEKKESFQELPEDKSLRPPEFKLIGDPKDSRVVIENVSLADLSQAAVYRLAQSALSVQANFALPDSTRVGTARDPGILDPNIFKTGKLILRFKHPNQAMAAASYHLCQLRTSVDRPKVVVYLPKPLKNQGALEQKLLDQAKRPIRLFLRDRQLVVRDVGVDVDGEMIRQVLGLSPLDEIQLLNEDLIKRRSAIVTLQDVESAILTHLKFPRVRLGDKSPVDEQRKKCDIFVMTQAHVTTHGILALKPELRFYVRKWGKRWWDVLAGKETGAGKEEGSSTEAVKRSAESPEKGSDPKRPRFNTTDEGGSPATPKRKRYKKRSGSAWRSLDPAQPPNASLVQDAPKPVSDGTVLYGAVADNTGTNQTAEKAASIRGAKDRDSFPSKQHKDARGFGGGRGRGLGDSGLRGRSPRAPFRGIGGSSGGGRGRDSWGSSPWIGGSGPSPLMPEMSGAPRPMRDPQFAQLTGMVAELQSQVTYQQQLLKQQEIINELADELARRRNAPKPTTPSGGAGVWKAPTASVFDRKAPAGDGGPRGGFGFASPQHQYDYVDEYRR